MTKTKFLQYFTELNAIKSGLSCLKEAFSRHLQHMTIAVNCEDDADDRAALLKSADVVTSLQKEVLSAVEACAANVNDEKAAQKLGEVLTKAKETITSSYNPSDVS
jgi:hypothetical protein